MTVPTGRESDKFMLRLPDGMRDRLKDEAAKNNRSMNSEIVARLEASFDSVPAPNDDMHQIIARQQQSINEQGRKIDNLTKALEGMIRQFMIKDGMGKD